MDAPKVFISYSHDTEEHKDWVLRLGCDLRSKGIDVVLDRWDLVAGQDTSLFMQKGISKADRVIMVCSASYVAKAEAGVGGVGYERLIVTAEMVANIDTVKFVPILRGPLAPNKTPVFLGPRMYIDFTNDALYDQKLTELVHLIHGVPAVLKPPLGPNPFSGTPPAAPPTRPLGPRGNGLLGGQWFSQHHDKALDRFHLLVPGLTAYMELRVGLEQSITKSQIELLNAVQRAEIKTFGWPIGITLEREEFRPRPTADGINAEVPISDEDRKSYDYWALRSDGDFYLLQSLFEDTRSPNKIFFDTRIVRVTESLMFIERLFTELGAPPETHVRFRVTHGGLKRRELTSANQRRYVSERTTNEDVSSSEITTILGMMHQNRVDDVRKLLAPMFMLFDFMEFADSVYEDIVRNFEMGKVA